MTTKRLSAAERPGMDFWFDKFCEEQGGITPISEGEWFMFACDFAQWFARHTVEAGEQYFGNASAQPRWIAALQQIKAELENIPSLHRTGLEEFVLSIAAEALPDAPEGDQS